MRQIPTRQFTVAEYQRLGETGILHEDERVELIDGELVQMAPIGSRHAGCVKFLNSWFSRRARGRALVSVQDPIRLSPHSEPEPDIALLRPRSDFYAGSHPGPEDVLLIVEVADTSLEYDRETKSPLYARAGIPDLWIVDLDAESVEVFRGPEAGSYRQRQVLARGAAVTPEALPDLILRVDEILGEERER